MQKKLAFDSTKCIGCLYCEMICSLRHNGIFARRLSRIKILTHERLITHEAFFCAHCEKPACADACQSGSISISADNGIVGVDKISCTGCGNCVLECPFGGIRIDEESKVASNCDLCQGSPACVDFCPSGALRYLPSET